MMYDDAGWGYWMMGLGLLALVLILVGVAVAVALASRSRAASTQPPGGATRHTSTEALHELDLRFARGEIDEQAYERSRAVLERPTR